MWKLRKEKRTSPFDVSINIPSVNSKRGRKEPVLVIIIELKLCYNIKYLDLHSLLNFSRYLFSYHYCFLFVETDDFLFILLDTCINFSIYI